MIKFVSTVGLAIVFAVSGTSAFGQFLYGISNGADVPEDNTIYRIDPSNGAISNVVQVTLPGFEVLRSQALAVRPGDLALFAVVQVEGSGRRLVRINPDTGVATDVGPLSQNISSLAFRPNGVLYAVSGDGAAIPETLFTVNTSTGALTQLLTLGNGDDGEVIAFHQNGLLYHSSGNFSAIFESINVDTLAVTPIGTAAGEAFAMGYYPPTGQFLLSDIESDLYSVDIATGARTFIGNIPSANDNRGLAFVLIPTASEVTVSGRVVGPNGRGISRAIVSFTDSSGEKRRVFTNTFGFYRFETTAGEILVINVKYGTLQFEPQVITVTDGMENVNFTASENVRKAK